MRTSAPFLALVIAGLCFAQQALAQYAPARNLVPGSDTITLGPALTEDAWLVYAYDIEADGSVSNARILGSNGVDAVEDAVLAQVGGLRFEPANRNGTPVKSFVAATIFTSIHDTERELSAGFSEDYRRAWDAFAGEDYVTAATIAGQLREFPGRNALEDTRARLLSAAVAHRQGEPLAEMRHLRRALKLQSLADRNNFRNDYLPFEQHIKVLSRVQELQLDNMQLADAGNTLEQIEAMAPGEQASRDAFARFDAASRSLASREEWQTLGYLEPVYPSGPGRWTTGLSRSRLSLSGVEGRVGSVYLVCGEREMPLRYPSSQPWEVPAGWASCEVEVTGRGDTRFTLHQY